MTPVTLQRAGIKDVETFLAIEKSVAHLKTYAAITSKKEALAELEQGTVYFIKKHGIIVGSIGYRMKSKDHATLSGFVVNSQFQGQGIGRAAFAKILHKLNSVKKIDLVTHPHNTPAIMLYLSFGFMIEAWKDNYFGDGQPRIVLRRMKQIRI